MGFLDFYGRVKSLVKTNKTTIEHIVGEAGLTLASYNAYRRNKYLPRADEALLIAQALGTTVEYLVSGSEPKSPTAEDTLKEIQAAMDRYRKAGKIGQGKDFQEKEPKSKIFALRAS